MMLCLDLTFAKILAWIRRTTPYFGRYIAVSTTGVRRKSPQDYSNLTPSPQRTNWLSLHANVEPTREVRVCFVRKSDSVYFSACRKWRTTRRIREIGMSLSIRRQGQGVWTRGMPPVESTGPPCRLWTMGPAPASLAEVGETFAFPRYHLPLRDLDQYQKMNPIGSRTLTLVMTRTGVISAVGTVRLTRIVGVLNRPGAETKSRLTWWVLMVTSALTPGRVRMRTHGDCRLTWRTTYNDKRAKNWTKGTRKPWSRRPQRPRSKRCSRRK